MPSESHRRHYTTFDHHEMIHGKRIRQQPLHIDNMRSHSPTLTIMQQHQQTLKHILAHQHPDTFQPIPIHSKPSMDESTLALNSHSLQLGRRDTSTLARQYDGSMMMMLKPKKMTKSEYQHQEQVSREVEQQRAALWATPANKTLATWIKMLPVHEPMPRTTTFRSAYQPQPSEAAALDQAFLTARRQPGYIVPNSSLAHTLIPKSTSILVHPDGDTNLELSLGAERDACLARSGVITMSARDALAKQSDGRTLIRHSMRAPASLVASDPIAALKMRYGHIKATTETTTTSSQEHEHQHEKKQDHVVPRRRLHRRRQHQQQQQQSHVEEETRDEPCRNGSVRPVSAPFSSTTRDTNSSMSLFQQHMARARATRTASLSQSQSQSQSHSQSQTDEAHDASFSASSPPRIRHIRSRSLTYPHSHSHSHSYSHDITPSALTSRVAR